MKIPLMTHVTGAASSSNPRYFSVAGGGPYTATVSNARTPAPVGGTISKLYVKTTPALTAGSYKIELLVKGTADPYFTATVSSGGSTANDTTHSVAITAGDLLEWKITPTSTPDALTALSVSAVFESGVARSAPLFTGHSSGTGAYFAPPGGITAITGEGFGSGVMAVAGDISFMTVKLTTAPGAGITRTYTLRKNGVDTGLTVGIADSATTGTVSSTVSFVAGDVVTVAVVSTGGTPAATHAGVGLTWNPTTNGYFPMTGVATSGWANTTTRYVAPSATSQGNNTDETQATGIAPVDMTIDMLYAQISTAPTAGRSRALTLRTANTTDTALTTTIRDAAIANQDVTNSVSPTAGTLISVSQVPTASPSAVVSYNRVGMRGFITPSDAAGRSNMLTLGAG